MYVFLNIAGHDQRQDDLFSTESLLAKGRSALKGLKVQSPILVDVTWRTDVALQGVQNVYTQHRPHLSTTMENLLRGRLRDTSYPFIESPGPNAGLQRYIHFLFAPTSPNACPSDHKT